MYKRVIHVEFSGQPLSTEQVRHALLSGLLVDSAVIPILITFALYHQEPLHWGFLVASVVCIMVPVAYVAVSLLLRRRQGRLDPDPMMVFIGVSAGVVSLAFIEAASGFSLGFYKPVFVLGALLIAIVGDARMRIAIAVLSVGLIAWTSWVEGIRGGHLVTVVLIYAWVIVVGMWLVVRTFQSLRYLGVSRDGLRQLAEAVAAVDNIHEAFEVALPLVDRVLSTDHVVVFLQSDGGTSVHAAWPAAEPGDLELADAPGFGVALERNAAAFADHLCFVPIGYDETGGQFVMAIRHERGQGEADLLVTETADQVAATFLKITSRIVYVSGLRRETRTDALTALANRRGLLESLETERARAGRYALPLSVAMVDLDRFKEHNDAYGHLAGDGLLRAFAGLLTAEVRAQDVVARFGGDEFCIVMPETDLTGAEILFDRMRGTVKRSDQTHGVMFSVGVAQWNGAEQPATLIERADRALYRAKDEGRDRVVADHVRLRSVDRPA